MDIQEAHALSQKIEGIIRRVKVFNHDTEAVLEEISRIG